MISVSVNVECESDEEQAVAIRFAKRLQVLIEQASAETGMPLKCQVLPVMGGEQVQ